VLGQTRLVAPELVLYSKNCIFKRTKIDFYGKAQGVVFTVGKDAPGIYLKEIE